jgi:hypothetical protein
MASQVDDSYESKRTRQQSKLQHSAHLHGLHCGLTGNTGITGNTVKRMTMNLASAAPTVGPLAGSNNSKPEQRREEEGHIIDRSVVTKPGHDCGRHLNNYKSSRGDEFLDPTEFDVTETEFTDESFSYSSSPRVVKAVPPVVVNSSRSSSLLPLSELVERLARVNREETPVHSRSRQIAARSSSTLTIEEMTRILTHINLCEATHTEPQRDMVPKLPYRDSSTTNASAKWDGPESLVSVFGSSNVVSSTDDDDYEECSIALEELHHIDSLDDGFSLDLTHMSCASSVTWLEGSLGEEETVSSDDEDIREALRARALSTGSFDDASIASATSSIFADSILLPGRRKLDSESFE